MKLYDPLFSRRGTLAPSPSVRAIGYSGAFALAPLPLAWQQVNLLTWLLVAVIGGIILIFVLIAFILRPLSKRTTPPPASPPADEIDTTLISNTPGTLVQEPPPTIVDEDTSTSTQPTLAEPTATPITLPASGERPAGIGWHIAGLTDVGLRRELNEDNLLLVEGTIDQLGPFGLYVVADGLGGHEAGEIASQLTVDTIKKHLAQNPPASTDVPFEEWFKVTVLDANDAVLQYQDTHQEAQKMGSTLVMALVVGQQAYITNVGDSRAYHLTESTIAQISTDHSLVERLVQIGQITREEARTHKQRNVVYSIIGEKRRLEIGFYSIALKAGERLLLCSDGLSGMITDEEILIISQNQPDLARTSQLLIESAKQAGGHDNITAVLIQMNGN